VVLYRKYRSGIIRAMSLRDEIKQQPAVVRRLLDEGWPEVRGLGRALARVEHVTLVARGSSDNAATYGKYLLESIAGIVTALAAPSLVTRYNAPPSYVRGAVIGISQSGASPDVVTVLAEARRQGATRLWLEVRTSNARAQRLYERLGYRALGLRKGYYPAPAGQREDAIVMGLDLTGGADGVE